MQSAAIMHLILHLSPRPEINLEPQRIKSATFGPNLALGRFYGAMFFTALALPAPSADEPSNSEPGGDVVMES